MKKFFPDRDCGILRSMKSLLFSGFLFFSFNVFAGEVVLLQAKDWAIPKKASTLLKMPAIQKVVSELDEKPGSMILIRFPGGDEGTLWANELRSWLVALGVSTERVILTPGSSAVNILELEVKT